MYTFVWAGTVLQFMLSLHNTSRPIYLSRHGQSQYNVLGKVGGDSDLSPAGEEYALKLAEFAETDILHPDRYSRLFSLVFFSLTGSALLGINQPVYVSLSFFWAAFRNICCRNAIRNTLDYGRVLCAARKTPLGTYGTAFKRTVRGGGCEVVGGCGSVVCCCGIVVCCCLLLFVVCCSNHVLI